MIKPQPTSQRLRFMDDDDRNWFTDFLVECPRCRRCAVIAPCHMDRRDAKWRLTCASCSHVKEIRPNVIYRGTTEGHDPFMRLPLWLSARCADGTVWAFNRLHLSWLESYVAATLREHRSGPRGWSNQSAANRLPRWIKSAKNRATVLRAINKLKRKIG